jgi:hypothetical protein
MGKHIDYITEAIAKCGTLNINNTQLKNAIIIEEGFNILLNNPGETRNHAYMIINHILVGLGLTWAQNLAIELII